MKMPKFMQHFISKKLLTYVIAIAVNWLVTATGFPEDIKVQFSEWLLNLSLGAIGAFTLQDIGKEVKAGVEARAKGKGGK